MDDDEPEQRFSISGVIVLNAMKDLSKWMAEIATMDERSFS